MFESLQEVLYIDPYHIAGQHMLGGFYRDGRGVKEDDKQAVAWFRKAAERLCRFAV